MMTSSGAAALQCAKHKTQRRQVTLFPNSLGRKKQSSSGSPLTYITKENSLTLSQLPLSVLFPFRRLLNSCCKMPMNRCCCYLTFLPLVFNWKINFAPFGKIFSVSVAPLNLFALFICCVFTLSACWIYKCEYVYVICLSCTPPHLPVCLSDCLPVRYKSTINQTTYGRRQLPSGIWHLAAAVSQSLTLVTTHLPKKCAARRCLYFILGDHF